jgi:hypothetical protein
MKAIFIRHNFKETDIVKYLWDKKRIAIQYDNIPSIDPEQYHEPEGKASIRRLLKYCKTGVVVGATYRAICPEKMLVGEIKMGSNIEIR